MPTNEVVEAPSASAVWEQLGDADGNKVASEHEKFVSELLPIEAYMLPWRELPRPIAETIELDLAQKGERSRYWGIDRKAYAVAWLKSVKRFSAL